MEGILSMRTWNICCDHLREQNKYEENVSTTPKEVAKEKKALDQGNRNENVQRGSKSAGLKVKEKRVDEIVERSVKKDKRYSWMDHVSFTQTSENYHRKTEKIRSPRMTCLSPPMVCISPRATLKAPIMNATSPVHERSSHRASFESHIIRPENEPSLVSIRSSRPQYGYEVVKKEPFQEVLSPTLTKTLYKQNFEPKSIKKVPNVESVRRNIERIRLAVPEQEFKPERQSPSTRQIDPSFKSCSLSQVDFVQSRFVTQNNTITELLRQSCTQNQVKKQEDFKGSEVKRQKAKASKYRKTLNTETTEDVQGERNNHKISLKHINFSNEYEVFKFQSKEDLPTVKQILTESQSGNKNNRESICSKESDAFKTKMNFSEIKLKNRPLTFSRNKQSKSKAHKSNKNLLQLPYKTVETINSILLDQSSALDVNFMEKKAKKRQLQISLLP